jgi:hypothetical protein
MYAITRFVILLWAALVSGGVFLSTAELARAVEGNILAGPIGGTDIRSATLPPPGLYGGGISLVSHASEVADSNGKPFAGLDAFDLTTKAAGPFLIYVPQVQVFGGAVGLLGVLPAGERCGQLVTAFPPRCTDGIADPYFELAWSRSFGQLRPSRDPEALPVMEGLTIRAGIGVVLPIGQYDSRLRATNGISIGNNTLDMAPSVAVTFTTRPLMFEGTEFSAKIYWNNYYTNPTTHYSSGSLINTDFAISERIGRFQAGLAGLYAFQVSGDRQFGIPVLPDGRPLELMALALLWQIVFMPRAVE